MSSSVNIHCANTLYEPATKLICSMIKSNFCNAHRGTDIVRCGVVWIYIMYALCTHRINEEANLWHDLIWSLYCTQGCRYRHQALPGARKPANLKLWTLSSLSTGLMLVFVCVCVCIYIYIQTDIYIYICVCVCMYICIDISIYIYIYVCIYIYIHIYIHLYIYIHVYMYIHVHMYIYIFTITAA